MTLFSGIATAVAVKTDIYVQALQTADMAEQLVAIRTLCATGETGEFQAAITALQAAGSLDPIVYRGIQMFQTVSADRIV